MKPEVRITDEWLRDHLGSRFREEIEAIELDGQPLRAAYVTFAASTVWVFLANLEIVAEADGQLLHLGIALPDPLVSADSIRRRFAWLLERAASIASRADDDVPIIPTKCDGKERG